MRGLASPHPILGASSAWLSTTVAVHGWILQVTLQLEREVQLCFRQAHDARQHGQYGREGHRMMSLIYKSLGFAVTCTIVRHCKCRDLCTLRRQTDFLNGLRIPRFDSGYILPSFYGCLWKNRICLREGAIPRLIHVQVRFAQRNLDIISTSSSYDVVDEFFAAFCGIFRIPYTWYVTCSGVSALAITKSSVSSRAPGGGDAGSLLPGVLPPELSA